MLHMIKFRRSIRNYREKIVEREKLEMMIEAGRYTATASNRQEISFLSGGLPPAYYRYTGRRR